MCPAHAAQPAGVAQYFRSRVRGLAPLQEHGNRLVVAMERRRMKRRVSRRSVDRCLLIVLPVDDRQAGAVAHDVRSSVSTALNATSRTPDAAETRAQLTHELQAVRAALKKVKRASTLPS